MLNFYLGLYFKDIFSCSGLRSIYLFCFLKSQICLNYKLHYINGNSTVHCWINIDVFPLLKILTISMDPMA